jgi:hypothetical protein
MYIEHPHFRLTKPLINKHFIPVFSNSLAPFRVKFLSALTPQSNDDNTKAYAHGAHYPGEVLSDDRTFTKKLYRTTKLKCIFFCCMRCVPT